MPFVDQERGKSHTRPVPIISREKAEETLNTGIRLPKQLLEELAVVAEKEGVSRNEVIRQMLTHGLATWREEQAAEKRKK